MSATKASIRKRVLDLRKNISAQSKQEKSNSICTTLFEHITKKFKPKSHILLFAPHEKEGEPNIWPLFEQLLENYICLFPKITDMQNSVFEAFPAKSKSDLTQSSKHFELLESLANDPVHPQKIDLVLVPAVAVDAQGNRIGHGQGYFDRFLTQVRGDCQKWVVVFSCQKTEVIPAEDHDIPMDVIVDEKGFTVIANGI